MEYPHDNERFLVEREKLPEAESALEFAARFGIDFNSESEVSIAAAPAYFRRMVAELQANSRLEWTATKDRNPIGFMTHVFTDGSVLQAYIVHLPHLPKSMDIFSPPPPEIYIDVWAEEEDTVERQITYELGREDLSRVIRTDVDLVAIGADHQREDNISMGEVEPVDHELIQAISREAAMLRQGIDPSFDLEIECLREVDEDFRQASDDQRERFRRRAEERQAGLNEQPVGIRELVALRRAILLP